jgi:hypothetical protein
VARFIFQHVFLATIVLEESSGDQFRLVRSKTPPTLPVEGDHLFHAKATADSRRRRPLIPRKATTPVDRGDERPDAG